LTGQPDGCNASTPPPANKSYRDLLHDYDTLIFLTTLQGIVNRRRPRLYPGGCCLGPSRTGHAQCGHHHSRGRGFGCPAGRQRAYAGSGRAFRSKEISGRPLSTQRGHPAG
jgi:hypothetical protein